MKDAGTTIFNQLFCIEEQFIASKTGHEETCEDAIYVGPHFIAVIDGATSKTDRRWNGETGGRTAAHLIRQAFDQIPYDATHTQAFDTITAAIRQFYKKHDALDHVATHSVQRLIASVVALSLFRKEVWFVGDCQCLLNQQHIWPDKRVDKIASQARAMFLETELLRGATIEELQQHDTGRALILPLLERQSHFQNNSNAGEYAYIVVDGFPIPIERMLVYSLPADTHTIVLASDGYPLLKDSLEASEKMLQEILREDPLLFRQYKSTKGKQEGHISFDDRSFVKLRLNVTQKQ